MVSQTELLDILNKEKDYEDRIAQDLFDYMTYSLDYIKDITEDEKDKVRKVFSAVANESRGHGQTFIKLIEMCIENGNDCN